MKLREPEKKRPPMAARIAAALLAGVIVVYFAITLGMPGEGAEKETLSAVSGTGRSEVVSAAGPSGSSVIRLAPESTTRPGENTAAPSPIATEAPIDDSVQLSDPLLVLVNDWVHVPGDWNMTLEDYSEDIKVDSRIHKELDALILDASEENIWLWVASGYRDEKTQGSVLQKAIQRRMDELGMTEEEAKSNALRTIARPGYSEHHTGLAIDFNTVSDDFESTEEYKWLCEHAADYGFVQRYSSDKVDITHIDNESWHYRYVGPEHAKKMVELDMCLEEYVRYLKRQGVS